MWRPGAAGVVADKGVLGAAALVHQFMCLLQAGGSSWSAAMRQVINMRQLACSVALPDIGGHQQPLAQHPTEAPNQLRCLLVMKATNWPH